MKLAHAGLIVADLARAAAFYEGILGLARDARPDLGFPGIFYRLEDGGQIHLMQLPDPCDGHARPAHGGRDRHIALCVQDWDALKARLEAAGIPFTMSRSGRAALFVRDPDGNAIELIRAGE
ncbi:MAG: VOC family protein [Mariprofundaceae bacterium]